MLFDSDVVIWCLRGKPSAQSLLNTVRDPAISAVSYMEVCRGFKNKQEALYWKSLIYELNIKVLPIDENISAKAMYWVEEFSLSHGLDIPDALIAATATTHGLPLITGNIKDYNFLPSLVIQHFKE
ncbi:MAG: type II toxin-antitoxin system VapC family toxin [Candidatus Omnitrophica bacterium]|nr:type II toxin-antitoxin system VapC family toxin [Candidatus Omnitrophota bacterium]